MAISFTETCPACKHLQTIYVEQEDIPASGTAIEFVCARCSVRIRTYPGAFVMDVTVPDGATVGEIVH